MEETEKGRRMGTTSPNRILIPQRIHEGNRFGDAGFVGNLPSWLVVSQLEMS